MQEKPTQQEIKEVASLVDDFYTEYLSKTSVSDPLTKAETALLRTFALYLLRAKKSAQAGA
jgi:hypothetical protein